MRSEPSNNSKKIAFLIDTSYIPAQMVTIAIILYIGCLIWAALLILQFLKIDPYLDRPVETQKELNAIRKANNQIFLASSLIVFPLYIYWAVISK